MDVGRTQMQRRLADYMNTLFQEGILDSQYLELHELQDESNPGFVVTQQNGDFKRAHAQAQKFKGSSCRCLRCLQQMKQEFFLMKSKLEALFELEQQVVAAGGSIPKMQLINPSDRRQL